MDDSRDPEPAIDEIFYRAEQVRFVHIDRYSGAKAAVALIIVLSVVTFITGLSTISQEDIALDGPLGPLFADWEPILQFGVVFSAFILGTIAIGLQRRKRLALYAAMILIPLIGSLPLVTLQSTHMPVLLLAIFALPTLLFNRSAFREALDLQPIQLAAILALVGVLSYGAIGSYALRDQFTGLDTISDAVYFVLVTIATVGYGDITPTTTQAQWFSLSVIVLGVGAFTAAIGALIVPAIEKRMASAFGNMTQANLSLLEDHVIILGYSDLTEGVLKELAGETDVVVITDEPDVATQLDRDNVNVLTADPTKTNPIADAGVEFASGVVVGTDDDPRDVLAILATRKLDPDVRIVAAATEPHNADTFRDVGADQVISPTEIGGKLLGRSVLQRTEANAILADLPVESAEESSR